MNVTQLMQKANFTSLDVRRYNRLATEGKGLYILELEVEKDEFPYYFYFYTFATILYHLDGECGTVESLRFSYFNCPF